MPIVSNASNKQMNVGKLQIKGVTMATPHGSPAMKRNSKLDCECLEKGGHDGRQPWGPTLQTKNLQAQGTTLLRQGKMARKHELAGSKGNSQQLRKPRLPTDIGKQMLPKR